MGWGRQILLDDIGHQHNLAEMIAEIDLLRHRLHKTAMGQVSVTDELMRLTVENNELKLYVSTIFRLLLDKGTVNKEELETLVRAIDRGDGVEDGQLDGPVLSA
jgi:hypothetical protein